MASDPGFLQHITDLFSGYGPLRKGRLFGGTSLYIGEAMIGVVFADTLYMKSDAALQPQFIAAGSTPFSYATKHGERVINGLMSLPESALDDPDEALEWLARSLVPARKAAAEKQRKST